MLSHLENNDEHTSDPALAALMLLDAVPSEVVVVVVDVYVYEGILEKVHFYCSLLYATNYREQNLIFSLTSSQAPSYASLKLRPTDLLTGVKCR